MDYYQHDLALVHARGFAKHADRCAPGILDLLAPVRGVLVDTSLIPALLESYGVTAAVGAAFGDAELPPGLRAVTGVRS